MSDFFKTLQTTTEAAGRTAGADQGALFEDVMKAKRQEVPQAVPPLQDTLAHGSIQGGKIQIVPDPGDPNNPFQALITNNDKTRQYLRIGKEYKGPLTASIKSSRDIDYDVGPKGRPIKEITEFVTDKQGKPTGIVVLDSDDDELFIPMASLGRIGKEPNPEAMLKDMKDQARAENLLDSFMSFSMNRSNEKPKTDLTEEQLALFREAFLMSPNAELNALLDPMGRDPIFRAQREEVKRRIAGDALGYSKVDGPYTGQNLSDYEVYEASEIDFDNASANYDEVATREYDGIKRTEFDDGSVFIDTGNGVINVTGHPGHDPNHEDYYGPPVDEED